MYPIGTIKLTWINPKDYSILESKMFSGVDIEQALKEAEGKKNFMLFILSDVEKDNYKWKLLPYGKYKEFVVGMKMRDSLLFKAFSVAILSFAVYGIYKIIK